MDRSLQVYICMYPYLDGSKQYRFDELISFYRPCPKSLDNIKSHHRQIHHQIRRRTHQHHQIRRRTHQHHHRSNCSRQRQCLVRHSCGRQMRVLA
ncbi:AVN_HP_G0120410.mRNA.1.CDS.1 [Saccharomyces cerevisiae]|nr:Aua1p [Saccharomyces cerevisiae YJM693]AJV25217.1 Aua1p [Saccharomyces cerevisiae YJM1463]CAI4940208.1 ANL_HP_G0011500.mRNA.1.CDS.1 [Saccharomyces cerevisiae]CAI4946094.1 ANL_HP_G0015730.mRNA.1.CDS.1 [Saccharomyces cerevisiae]CAI4955630.1 ANL_HP_G0022160.mRNA.1.CDS.1 [Saccharomyces cerevisiae]